MLFTVECSNGLVQSAMSTRTGVTYEVTPLSSVLLAYGCYHFGIYITFVCWNVCAVSDDYGLFFLVGVTVADTYEHLQG
jgi:hypothetical protein